MPLAAAISSRTITMPPSLSSGYDMSSVQICHCLMYYKSLSEKYNSPEINTIPTTWNCLLSIAYCISLLKPLFDKSTDLVTIRAQVATKSTVRVKMISKTVKILFKMAWGKMEYSCRAEKIEMHTIRVTSILVYTTVAFKML